jgi:hypothetical protein
VKYLSPLSILLALLVPTTQTFAQESRSASECPTVRIACLEKWANGAPVVSVIVSGDNASQKLSFKWKVSGMKIVAGQGTSTITLERPTIESHSFSAVVEVIGLPQGCWNKPSCGVVIEVLPKFAEFNYTNLKDNDLYLKRFASRLKVAVGAQAYIIIYGNPSDSRGKVERLVTHLKESLVKDHDIVPERIVTVNGGYRKHRSVELWIVPTGFAPPEPTPTVFLKK